MKSVILGVVLLLTGCVGAGEIPNKTAGAKPVPLVRCVGSRIPQKCEQYRATAAEQQAAQATQPAAKVPGPR